jgi:hypothetical protein
MSVEVAAPLYHRTIEPGTKFVPVRVICVAAAPMVAELGLTLESVGFGSFTVKVRVPLAPPPGARFTIHIRAVPAVVRSLAGIVALTCPLEPHIEAIVVVVEPLYQRTRQPATKLVPVKETVVSVAPAVAVLGLTAVKVGTGLLRPGIACPPAWQIQ